MGHTPARANFSVQHIERLRPRVGTVGVCSYEFFFGSERTATDDEVRAVEVQMSRLQVSWAACRLTTHTLCAVCCIAECCGVAG